MKSEKINPGDVIVTSSGYLSECMVESRHCKLGAMELDTEKDVGVAGKVGCVMGNVGSNFIFGATD